jgi:hypothetical protein
MATILAMPAHALAEGASEVDSTLTTLVLHNDSNLRTSTARPRPYSNRYQPPKLAYPANPHDPRRSTRIQRKRRRTRCRYSFRVGRRLGLRRPSASGRPLSIGFIPNTDQSAAKFNLLRQADYIPLERGGGTRPVRRALAGGIYFNTRGGPRVLKDAAATAIRQVLRFLSTRFRLSVLASASPRSYPDYSRQVCCMEASTGSLRSGICELYIRSGLLSTTMLKISEHRGHCRWAFETPTDKNLYPCCTSSPCGSSSATRSSDGSPPGTQTQTHSFFRGATAARPGTWWPSAWWAPASRHPTVRVPGIVLRT